MIPRFKNNTQNILFMNTGTGWGGVEGWHYKTATELKNRGYSIFVLAVKDKQFYEKCKEVGLIVDEIKQIKNGTFMNPYRVFWLVKYLKKNNIDAIFFCQSSHFKYASVAAKIAGLEKVIYRRALAKPINNRFYNKLFLKYCITDLMFISKVTRDESLKYISSDYFSREKMKLIYNGVKVNDFSNPNIKTDIKEEFGIKDNELIIGNIGRLCRQKAQHYLIEALPKVLKEFNNIKVLLVGSGGKKEVFKDRVKELGIENKVIFTGFREDIPSILKQIDFMVHTAIYEGCPWIILEGMMVGVPIVATDSTSLPEFIVDGETGYLAENKNSDDIAQKVINMINNQDRDKMGERAAEIARNQFSFKRMIDDIEEKILNT